VSCSALDVPLYRPGAGYRQIAALDGGRGRERFDRRRRSCRVHRAVSRRRPAIHVCSPERQISKGGQRENHNQEPCGRPGNGTAAAATIGQPMAPSRAVKSHRESFLERVAATSASCRKWAGDNVSTRLISWTEIRARLAAPVSRNDGGASLCQRRSPADSVSRRTTWDRPLNRTACQSEMRRALAA